MSDTQAPSPHPSPKGRGIAMTLCTLLIITALAAGLAWQYWRQQQQQQHWQTQFTNTQQQLQQLHAQLSHGTQQRSLLTAQHTLQLANYQRHYHHDAKATIALLQLAAQQLNPTQYPTLQSVHNALQRDISTMQSHATQNPSAWLIKLDALKHSIPLLQQIPSTVTPSTATSDTADPTQNTQNNHPSTTEQHLWQRAWHKTKQLFSTMVVLRHTAQPITPLLGANDLAALQNNLALTLSQAQWAIMNHQAKLYQQSINSATQMLSHFAANDPNTEQFSKQLASLAHAPVDATLPTLDSSFAAIDHALDRQDHTPQATPSITAKPHATPEDTDGSHPTTTQPADKDS